ncbi:hypothetical protein JW935_28500 [candidate division KSB1 bacterium]|nr:hypothetical protein [candidate division KSB1 bacterium]
MLRKHFPLMLVLIYSFLLTLAPLSAQEEGEIIIVSKRVGKEIDKEERDQFKLFKGINGFQSAVYTKLPDGRYFLEITYLDENTGEEKINRVLQSELSVKNRGDYIDRFEEIQAPIEAEDSTNKTRDNIDHFEESQALQDTVDQPPATAYYFELLGKGFLYSLNVDFRLKRSTAIGFGLAVYGADLSILNSTYYYLIGKKNKKFETGCGIDFAIGNEGSDVLFYGVLGYRYQKKNKSIFRISCYILPQFFSDAELPSIWFGLSFGKSL